MELTSQHIIGELVAQDYRCASVFQSYGIDYCCKGNRTLSEVCEARHIDPEVLMEAIRQVTVSQEDTGHDYNAWPLDLLADYIEEKHHRYAELKIREIPPLLDKLVKVHGAQHPELGKVKTLFNLSAGEMVTHMKKEELVLFPFIRKMVKLSQAKRSLSIPYFGTVRNPIAVRQQEHEAEGDFFREITALTDQYTPPYDACTTYLSTLSMLKDFEKDLHLHIHLENNILFPKAVEMEKKLLCIH